MNNDKLYKTNELNLPRTGFSEKQFKNVNLQDSFHDNNQTHHNMGFM